MEMLFSLELLIATLALTSIYALVALGLNLIYGAMRLLNVAHGEIMMLGAYVAFWLFTVYRVSPLVSMFGAMLVAALLGWLCYELLIKRLSSTPALVQRIEANSLLVFFAFSVILQNLGAMALSPNARSYSYMESLIQIGSVSVSLNRLVIIGVSAVATLAVMLFFRFHITGLAIRALIQQRDASSLVGIYADKVNRVIFCLGFALAALAGSLVSMVESITPFSGFPFTMAAFFVIILGGLGSIGGSVVGALLMACVEVYGSALTSPAYRSILLYGIFILVLFVRPQGLFGKKVA
ncbi:branched-chain amino acid ABC transporter permease [Eoetvoesiella caeni]|uniref:Branched-chain amino acid transport system permease protein n=1 Tax=Eoetvoesiella caeni TaxID=645616 RepID=A0A366H224_9BURK|nr:branched-chain amino acid ABC transporter permease [Eoetvoesiella caeni]MCI2811116.1 branched-chain amino acid ABC transporter permease [Eoetvoesiella caeni]NYT57081.1 branched-chain amino acid ABC transporter permease [Eoetvoesiella caeni]RBP35081.1 branched-chain amino acid transport system permease protein [Eoetvoesiella caeni]